MNSFRIFGFSALMIVMTLALASIPASAQQPSSEEGEIHLSSEEALSAVRISIVNGIIDYANKAKHARIAVDWEILPVDSLLKEDAAGGFVIPQILKFSNGILADGHWPRAFPKELVAAISHDLGGPPLDHSKIDKTTLDRWHEEFLTDWLSGAKAQVAKQSLLPRTYYALLRDHNLLYFVLRGNGIGIYIDADSQQPVLGLPKVAGDGTTWVIRQYAFKIDKENDIWVYRYGVSARSEPFDIYISNLTQEKITLSAQVGIRPSALSVGLFTRLFPLQNFEVKLDPPREERIEKIADGGAVKRVNAVLDLLRAPELGTLITRGLFAGSEKTSLVTGLLATDDRIRSFVGANTDLRESGRDWRLGLLFGTSPQRADALYLGPSLRNSVLLASVGAHLVGEDSEGSSSQKLRGEFGGVLSIDLGALFGAREEITKVRVAQSRVGGNWGISSDFIGQGLGYVEITYSDPSDPTFEAVQVTDFRDRPVDPRFAQIIRFVPQEDPRRLFLPAGAYRLIIPEGRQLLDQGFPASKTKLQVGTQIIEDHFLIIPWETATGVEYDLQ